MSKSKLPADDLFEKSSMSFGEHLEELRRALGKGLLWLGVGTVIGLMFANQIVKYIETPLKLAIRDFHIAQAKEQFKKANGVEPSDALASWMMLEGMMPERVFIDPKTVTEPTDVAAEAPVASVAEGAEHVVADALKVESAVSGSSETDHSVAEITEDVKSVDDSQDSAGLSMTEPLGNPWKNISIEKLERLRPLLIWRPIPNRLVSLNAMEGFMIWMKAGLVSGVVIGSPGIFWYIWQFLAAGLYPHERRYVYWYLPLSLLLFMAGVSLAFFVVFRLVLGFLMTYTTGLDVEFTPRLNDYMSFALFLPLGFGIAFQLPIVMLGLHRFGVVTVETFVAQWRIAVLSIAFLSMLCTPADIYSMLGLFIPLVALYFFGIGLCKYMPKGAGIGSMALDPRG